MGFVSGTRLGPYEILDLVGAGGMGEVYRARDAKLDREVAIKVLPEGLLADETARSRFRNEARALSRLNHPHVATILDFDTVDGVDFLAMELVGGPSLEETLGDGPLPEKEVVRLGAQIARGLQAAHEQGIVHRDLKPSNVRLTPDGLVKILDFGLARLEKPVRPEETTTALTHAGTILGTPLYMSPEQVLGRRVDARADLYSTGALLYSLATGRRPHEGRAGVELFDAILHREVDSPRDLNPSISPGLEGVIVKLLDKDPERRYQSARELVVDLERLRESGARSESTSTRAIAALSARRSRRRRAWTLAAVVALVALVVAATWLLRPPPVPKVREIRRITSGLGAALMGGAGNWATVVSDGVRAYYVANKDGKQGLWQVPIAGGDPVPIPVPLDGAPLLAYVHSQSALLTLGATGPEDFTDDGMALWLVPVPTGSPRRVGKLRAWAAALSPDEKQIAFATRGAIGLAGIDGSSPRELLRTAATVGGLRWSADGRLLRYSSAGELGRAWIWETAIERPSARPLWPGQGGDWTADRRFYIFTRRSGPPAFGLTMSATGSDVFIAPESRRPWTRAEPVPLTFGPIRFQSPVSSREGGPLLAWGELASSELQRLDRRTGRFEPFLPGTAAAYADVSRDGAWVAWVSYPEGALWRARADGSDRVQLTAAPLEVHQPRFSPDGRRIAFVARSSDEPLRSVYVVAVDGTDGGKPRLLSRPLAPGQECWDLGWAPDGRSVVFGHSHPAQMITAAPGLYRVSLDGTAAVREPGSEAFAGPVLSRQGHVVAYEVQRGDPFVRWAGKEAWKRLPAGLYSPVWKKDGRSVCGLQGAPIEVRCFSFDTGRAEVLARVGQPLLAVSNMPALFLDAEDQPIVVVDRSARDIYALEWAAP